MIKKNDPIYVSGHTGLLGSSIIRRLKKYGYNNLITIKSKHLDLTNQNETYKFIKKKNPKCVIIAAAHVGGIFANNKYRADFIYKNIMIQNNLIHSSYLNNVNNLIFFGSSCVYPKFCKQPIKEKYLLSGSLEKTNEPYAIAKIAGIKMCENYNKQYSLNYKCLMPCNAFGPNDNYNLETSHFLPAVIRKIYEAKKLKKNFIELWGTGKAKRELIFVDDIAEACIFFMNIKTKHNLINIGSNEEKTIKSFARLILKKFDTNLILKFDNNKLLDGTPRKIMDCSIAKSYGWKKKYSLDYGLKQTIEDYIKNH